VHSTKVSTYLLPLIPRLPIRLKFNAIRGTKNPTIESGTRRRRRIFSSTQDKEI